MKPYALLIPLASAIVTFALCLFMKRHVPGRFPRDFILASGSSGLWALSILLELALENFLLDTVLRDPEALPVLSPAAVFWLVKLASMIAGCMSMCVPFFCVLMALNFPPRIELGVWRVPVYSIAAILALLSWWGVDFELRSTGIVRTPGPIAFLQMIAWFLVGGVSLGVFAYKARDFSSPLRRLEARYVPMGMLGAFVIGGGLGYGSTFLAQGIAVLVAATAGPAVFVAIVVLAFAFSRELFAEDLDGILVRKGLKKGASSAQIVAWLREQNIHVSYFEEKRDRYFDATGLELAVPDEIKASPSGKFFREEYDDLPGTAGFEFVHRSYVQAGVFCAAGLLLVHRIGSGKILASRHLESLRDLFELSGK